MHNKAKALTFAVLRRRARSALGVGLWSLLALLIARVAPAMGRFPALDTPAAQSAHPNGAAMLAIARAGKRLVAAGERGIVLVSDDNGVSWRQVRRVPVSVSLTALQFVTPKIGWAVGHFGVVLRSNDGGRTWVRQLDGIRAAQLALAAAKQRIDGAASPTPEMKRSLADAKRLVADGPDKPFLSLYFRDPQHGFVLGAFNLAFETDDGGLHWHPWMRHIDNPLGYHLYGVAPVGDTLLIAGERGTLLRSTDGGRHFMPLKKPYGGSWFGLLTTHDGAVVVFGLVGTVYRSDDGGAHWQHSDSGSTASISAGTVLDNGDVVLTTVAGDVLISGDDGRSFQQLASLGVPLTGVVQAADGRLVVTSMHGIKETAAVQRGVAHRED